MNQQKTDTMFHPSIFESPNQHTPKDDRTLLSVRQQRGQRLTNSSVEQMTSPGSYKFTENDRIVSGSNTKHLFKNLYGETLLTFLFFSDKNIDSLQRLIQFIVHRETGYTIDKQSYNEQLIVMRSIFLEYSAHPPLIDDDMPEPQRLKLQAMYTQEVSRLNEIVVNSIVPKLISQMQQYLDYLRDASTQPYQMDKPENDNSAGQRQYRSITQVLLGGDL
jgi:hypothetical protein